MLLFHTSHQAVQHPDVHLGRANADFGQGFYLTTDEEFASRWARLRKGEETVVNAYELDLERLAVHRFERDEAWFSYIFANRSGREDSLPDADVIIGPVANDTIYDTYGIFTSGLMEPSQALGLLQMGPAYMQVAIKTEKAARKLAWLSSKTLDPEDVLGYRSIVLAEEAAYQELIAEAINTL